MSSLWTACPLLVFQVLSASALHVVCEPFCIQKTGKIRLGSSRGITRTSQMYTSNGLRPSMYTRSPAVDSPDSRIETITPRWRESGDVRSVFDMLRHS